MAATATATSTKPKPKRRQKANTPTPISLDFTPKEMGELSEAKLETVREKLRAFVLGASASKLRALAKDAGIVFEAADVDAMISSWKKSKLLEFAEKSGIEIPKSANVETILQMLREHRDQWVPVKEIQSAQPRI